MKMRSKLLMRLVLVALSALVMLPGCPQAPAGTVLIDTDGDGNYDALARDDDGDGKPDLDKDGQPKIVKGSKGYKIAETIDAVLPIVLTTVGTILSGGALSAGLLAGGAAWKKAKFARLGMNLVMSVQAARDNLKKTPEMKAALKIVNEALDAVQSPETQAMVTEVKKVVKAAKDAKAAAKPMQPYSPKQA